MLKCTSVNENLQKFTKMHKYNERKPTALLPSYYIGTLSFLGCEMLSQFDLVLNSNLTPFDSMVFRLIAVGMNSEELS